MKARIVGMVTLTLLASCAASFGLEYQWVNESQDFPPTIGGIDVLQYKDAGLGGIDWNGSSLGEGYGTVHLYLMAPPSSAWTTFTVKSSAVAFVMYGDGNDGYARFLVDGVPICTQDMYNLGGQSLVVTSLPYDFHTITVEQIGVKNPLGVRDDVAIAGGAALLPEPATLSLLALGGLALLRRRRA